MKKIGIVTATRAEYGILTPLIREILKDDELELELIVTGTHLSKKHGNTIEQIKADGFPIKASIPILEEGNTPLDVSVTVANAVTGFAGYFRENRPDLLVILGDRTEMLGVAVAAMNERILMCHIHGGEVTQGAVDDCVRHALTKMSYLHFTGTEVYRKRVIQLGEHPDRVFNVGTLSAENILTTPLLSEKEIREELGIDAGRAYAVVTLHPETVDDLSPTDIANLLCQCMEEWKDLFFVITAANADAGGDQINRILEEFASKNDNAGFWISLGMKRYLSAVKAADLVLGNSSSGIVEAPVLGIPTVNIGNRQRGRLMADSILNVPFEKERIREGIEKARKMEHIPSTMYGDGTTSKKMVQWIKHFTKSDVDLKKGFYDLKTIPKEKEESLKGDNKG